MSERLSTSTNNIAKRDVNGGPAESEVARMIKSRRKHLKSQLRRLSLQQDALKMVEKDLLHHSDG